MIPIGALAALIGLATGLVLGLAARLGDFCTLGAIESASYGGDQTLLRMWGVVLGTAILSTFVLAEAGHIDLSQTFYHSIAWNPLTSILGGLLFGYGMALAGNCGFGALIRFGSGDLRAMVVVVVMAITGFITLSGPLSELRIFLFPQHEASGMQGYAHLVARQLNVSPLIFAALVAAALVWWALSHEGLRHDMRRLGWSVAAGLSFSFAFWGTTVLNDQSFGAIGVEGHSFTAPLGRTMMWLMTSSAGGLNFGIGSVAGVFAGALVGSAIKQRFRWEACEDPRELGRQVAGAALMGVGGVLALGCSIGQGVSAFATLSYSAPVTLGAIWLGANFGLRQMIEGFQPD